jgi:NAD(P)-dependent dehydrogenase (short-subunit alcohol dehydrogenase family)
MSEKGKTAYITGGASGIGLALATSLAKQGVNLYIADRNLEGVQKASKHLIETYGIRCNGLEVDVASWEQQADAFREATKQGRVNYVFPIAGIGEKTWVKNDPRSKEGDYEEPNLVVCGLVLHGYAESGSLCGSQVIDVDLKGVLYTTSLAIQHFRRQQPDSNGIRGKSGVLSFIKLLRKSMLNHRQSLR